MTVSELIEDLMGLDPTMEIVAGEWVSPSQLGKPVIKVSTDYVKQGSVRAHLYAPKPESWGEEETDKETISTGLDWWLP